MPIPDLGPRLSGSARLRMGREKTFIRRLAGAMRRLDGSRRGNGKPDNDAGEAVPVDPHRPLDLSGGAAAALAFDD